MAVKRIKKELEFLKNNPIDGINADLVGEDIFEWQASILGPDDSPYEGGIFLMRIKFPKDYPFCPPKCKFITKIYHPNISANGIIYLGILMDQWSPALEIHRTLLSILAIINDPTPESLVFEIGLLYKNDPAKFKATAQEWTRKYAIRSFPQFG